MITSAVVVEELLGFWLKVCIHGALLFSLAAISVCFVVAAMSALPLQISCTFHRNTFIIYLSAARWNRTTGVGDEQRACFVIVVVLYSAACQNVCHLIHLSHQAFAFCGIRFPCISLFSFSFSPRIFFFICFAPNS